MICQRSGCTNEATKIPEISFSAEGHPDGERCVLQLGLYLCDSHCNSDPSLYLSDISKKHIENVLKDKQLAMPDWDSVKVIFVNIQ